MDPLRGSSALTSSTEWTSKTRVESRWCERMRWAKPASQRGDCFAQTETKLPRPCWQQQLQFLHVIVAQQVLPRKLMTTDGERREGSSPAPLEPHMGEPMCEPSQTEDSLVLVAAKWKQTWILV